MNFGKHTARTECAQQGLTQIGPQMKTRRRHVSFSQFQKPENWPKVWHECAHPVLKNKKMTSLVLHYFCLFLLGKSHVGPLCVSPRPREFLREQAQACMQWFVAPCEIMKISHHFRSRNCLYAGNCLLRGTGRTRILVLSIGHVPKSVWQKDSLAKKKTSLVCS
ncbi:hypothetical protein METSCH_B05540 [Metschnikowia aff. pulcherrima]|uniref:Uncharacterized protein n=1 Tax=Metschnikowia aff. pulcherrima TaxID=2163413 RepID=A0A4P6XJ90_9ASCO|nr:hypothetical protein METSCH_B05540 [Metschnikowia aff. pulcherrima]